MKVLKNDKNINLTKCENFTNQIIHSAIIHRRNLRADDILRSVRSGGGFLLTASGLMACSGGGGGGSAGGSAGAAVQDVITLGNNVPISTVTTSPPPSSGGTSSGGGQGLTTPPSPPPMPQAQLIDGSGNAIISLQQATSGVTLTLQDEASYEIDLRSFGLEFYEFRNVQNLRGSDYSDNLVGNDADNQFHWSLGGDSYDGGEGTDSADYSDFNIGASPSVTADLTQGWVRYADAQGVIVSDTISGIEKFIGSSGDDVIRGTVGADDLFGGDGDDIFVIIGSHGSQFNYNAQSLTVTINGKEYDFSSPSSLGLTAADINTAQGALSEAQLGDIIDGGGGTNHIVIYGEVDLSNITIRNISGGEIYINSELTVSEQQLLGEFRDVSFFGRDENSTLVIQDSDGVADLRAMGDLSQTLTVSLVNEQGQAVENPTFTLSDDLIDRVATQTIRFGKPGGSAVLDFGDVGTEHLRSLAVLLQTTSDSVKRRSGGQDLEIIGRTRFDEESEIEDIEASPISAPISTGVPDTSPGSSPGSPKIPGGDKPSDARIKAGLALAERGGQKRSEIKFVDKDYKAPKDGGAAAETLLGSDENNLINGGDGISRIRGYGGDDTLNGGGGNDRILGDKGMDSINGGDGDDWIRGGAGNDMLSGGTGDDTLKGGAGFDTVVYTADQTIDLELWQEEMHGSDTIGIGDSDGLFDADTVSGVEKIIIKGEQDDSLFFDVALSGSYGITEVEFSGAGRDTFEYTGAEKLSFSVNDGNISLNKLLRIKGAEVFYTYADVTITSTDFGGVTLDGNARTDLYLGEGFNELTLDTNLFGGIRTFHANNAGNSITGVGDDTYKIIGGSGNDTLGGEDFNGSLEGGVGDDALQGDGQAVATYRSDIELTLSASTVYEGAETLTINANAAGLGTDTLSGVRAIYVISNVDNQFSVDIDVTDISSSFFLAFGEKGEKQVKYTHGAFNGTVGIDTEVGAITFGGLSIIEANTLTLSDQADNVEITHGDFYGLILDGGSGADNTLTLADGLDSFTVNSAAFVNFAEIHANDNGNTIIGDGNDNIIVGGAGDDTLRGGGGDDTAVYASDSALSLTLSDAVYDSEGTQTLTIDGLGSDTLSGIESLTIQSDEDSILIFGDGADIEAISSLEFVQFTGEGQFEVRLSGYLDTGILHYNNVRIDQTWFSGVDTITLSEEAENISIGFDVLGFRDTVLDGGGGAANTLTLNNGVRTLTLNDNFVNFTEIHANHQGNTIIGNGDDNTIIGGSGNDTLRGGGGDDTLRGGAGNDTVVYTSADFGDGTIYIGVWYDRSEGTLSIYDNRSGLLPDEYTSDTISDIETIRIEGDGHDEVIYEIGGIEHGITRLEFSGGGHDIFRYNHANGVSGLTNTISVNDGTLEINDTLQVVGVEIFALARHTVLTSLDLGDLVFNGLNFEHRLILGEGITEFSVDLPQFMNILNVQGNDAGNRITTGDFNNFIYGGDGDDVIESRGGRDNLYGEGGSDTALYSSGEAIQLTLTGYRSNRPTGFNSLEVADTVGHAFGGNRLYDFETININGDGDDILTVSLDTSRLENNEIVTFTGGGQDKIIYSLDTSNFELDVSDGIAQFGNLRFTGVETLTLSEAADDITITATDFGGLVLDGGSGAANSLSLADEDGTPVNLGENAGFVNFTHLSGNNQDNHITGGSLDNRLTGRGGNDTLDGGAGNDSAYYSSFSVVDLTLLRVDSGDKQTLTVRDTAGTLHGRDSLIDIETITINGDANNRLIMNAFAEQEFTPFAVEFTGGGNDSFVYTHDVFNGAITKNSDNTINFGDIKLIGVETITLTDQADNIIVNNENPGALIDGGTGAANTITLADGFRNFTLLSQDSHSDEFYRNFSRVEGNALDNIIGSNENSNTLIGGDGTDTVEYESGSTFTFSASDKIIKKTGNGFTTDTISEFEKISIDINSDVSFFVDGTIGDFGSINEISFANATTKVTFLQDLAASVSMSDDGIVFTQGEHSVTFSGVDTFTLNDYQNDLTIRSSDFGSTLFEVTENSNADNFIILGSGVNNFNLLDASNFTGFQHISGNGQDNRITGDHADNEIRGRAGNDTLRGIGGNDDLYGGAGNDTFVVSANRDTVHDFRSGDQLSFTEGGVWTRAISPVGGALPTNLTFSFVDGDSDNANDDLRIAITHTDTVVHYVTVLNFKDSTNNGGFDFSNATTHSQIIDVINDNATLRDATFKFIATPMDESSPAPLPNEGQFISNDPTEFFF